MKLIALIFAGILAFATTALAARPATQNYSLQVPLTGFSITAPNWANVVELAPAGTLATGTLTMPAAPIDGQMLTVVSTQIVTALTHSANTAQTLNNALTTLPANVAVTWQFNASKGTWYYMGAALASVNGVSTYTGALTAAGLISGGTKFTASGCSNGTTLGGATAGTLLSGTTGTCTIVITMNGATGLTATNGWICDALDRTTVPALFTGLMMQTATSATTATISGTTVSGDLIAFKCIGY